MASAVKPDSTLEPDLQAALEVPLDVADGVEMDGFLDDRYSLRTQRRWLSYRTAAHPRTLPLVIETLLPTESTVITLPSTLGSVRTLTPVVVYRTPVALGEALLAAALAAVADGAVADGAKVGGFSFAEGLARNALTEVELLTAGREAVSRLVRAEALAVAVGVGVATGAGTAAVYSGCGQIATATAVARTPTKATGATTRPTRTASGGRAARRGRERANPNHSPEYIRPRSNRYLRGSLSINDHKFIFSGPKAGRCGEGHIYAPPAHCLTHGRKSPGHGRAGCACSRTRSGCRRPRTATADPPRGRRRLEDPT